jgi:DNA-binding transcriptional ArsR family regulator
METNAALTALSALAQDTRLAAFRLLVSHEPEGLPAGEVARLLDVPQNTLSAHLKLLSDAGLVTAERQGRSIVYRASLLRMQALTLYLLQDCCGGKPDLCVPVMTSLAACCPTPGVPHDRPCF